MQGRVQLRVGGWVAQGQEGPVPGAAGGQGGGAGEAQPVRFVPDALVISVVVIALLWMLILMNDTLSGPGRHARGAHRGVSPTPGARTRIAYRGSLPVQQSRPVLRPPRRRAGGWIVLAGVVALLAATNPGMNRYSAWADQTIAAYVSSRTGSSFLGHVAGSVTGWSVGMDTQSFDLVLGSVYRTSLPNGQNVTVIGVLGHFVPVSGLPA